MPFLLSLSPHVYSSALVLPLLLCVHVLLVFFVPSVAHITLPHVQLMPFTQLHHYHHNNNIVTVSVILVFVNALPCHSSLALSRRGKHGAAVTSA